MSNQTGLVLGVAMIGAAYYMYSRQSVGTPGYVQGGGAMQGAGNMQTQRGPQPLGTGSMPGSAGTGVAQIIGGIFGNLKAPMTGGGTSTGAPVPTPFTPYAGDDVNNNSVGAADPMNTFDPSLGAAVGDNMGGMFS